MCRWLSSFSVFIWQEGWKKQGEEDRREKGDGRMDRGREREGREGGKKGRKKVKRKGLKSSP